MGDQALFYFGIILMACAAIGAVIEGVIAHISGKRLQEKLEKEFGKRRR